MEDFCGRIISLWKARCVSFVNKNRKWGGEEILRLEIADLLYTIYLTPYHRNSSRNVIEHHAIKDKNWLCNYKGLKAIPKDVLVIHQGKTHHCMASESGIILLLLHSEVQFSRAEWLVLEASSTTHEILLFLPGFRRMILCLKKYFRFLPQTCNC